MFDKNKALEKFKSEYPQFQFKKPLTPNQILRAKNIEKNNKLRLERREDIRKMRYEMKMKLKDIAKMCNVTKARVQMILGSNNWKRP